MPHAANYMYLRKLYFGSSRITDVRLEIHSSGTRYIIGSCAPFPCGACYTIFTMQCQSLCPSIEPDPWTSEQHRFWSEVTNTHRSRGKILNIRSLFVPIWAFWSQMSSFERGWQSDGDLFRNRKSLIQIHTALLQWHKHRVLWVIVYVAPLPCCNEISGSIIWGQWWTPLTNHEAVYFWAYWISI